MSLFVSRSNVAPSLMGYLLDVWLLLLLLLQFIQSLLTRITLGELIVREVVLASAWVLNRGCLRWFAHLLPLLLFGMMPSNSCSLLAVSVSACIRIFAMTMKDNSTGLAVWLGWNHGIFFRVISVFAFCFCGDGGGIEKIARAFIWCPCADCILSRVSRCKWWMKMGKGARWKGVLW